MAFTVPIFTKFVIAYRRRMDIFYSELHQNWCGNMEITGINSFAPLSKGMHANAPNVKELIIVRQLFVKNFYAEFHENVANGLAADTRTLFPHKAFFFILFISFLFLFIIIIFFYGSLIRIQCPSVGYLVPATKLLQEFS